MLRLENASIAMDDRFLNASFDLQPGARVAVLGPSGAGKSTLLDAIAGFRPLASGAVHWNKSDMSSEPPSARPVSILFQDGNLFPHLDLRRNLGLALRPDGGRLSSAQTDRLIGALGQVGLGGMENRKPGTLSGGQQSRAALARVLLQARPILLLDEPFAALGPAMKTEMLELVKDVAGRLGALTLMVTHDPKDARAFAEQVVLVADGNALPPVETQSILDNPPKAMRAYLGTED
ncbi:thiamine ABC transporter ATP-binding protein [Thalassococcus lentus]|uniref:ATP-binding cassette domain-containing protein n=1 Tax=Thalassococcus lentus TaxID=1210524 RepID=A0ABT4XWF3_9RHOB|nr:ATP-binding cassette domain-containing protein [Thalassococcus lentus]MDA7426306.1 ATP-binding cassette domain-containing protein [Thalassococcus lentus]